MLLIRGIRGEQFAKEINNGLVGCRDLVSLIHNENKTGYKFSAYNEPVYRTARNKRTILFMPRETPDDLRELIHTYVDYYTFETYATFFHIVEPGITERWLENSGWDDNTRFIYYEPKLPIPNSYSLLGRDYCGGRMNYVSSSKEISDRETLLNNPCITVFFDWETHRCPSGPIKDMHLQFFDHLMVPLLNRVEDDTFTCEENEYRIIVRTPRMLYPDGHIQCNVAHPQKVTINGDIYLVKNRMYGPYPSNGRPRPIDITFIPENPRLRRLSILDIAQQKMSVEPISAFEQIDVRDTAIRYGYIGNLDNCRIFIQRSFEDPQYRPPEDVNNHYFHGNWNNYKYVVERTRPIDEVKYVYHPTERGYYSTE